MKNILVTVNLDEGSKQLVEKAGELAEKFGSKVWVLHIADPEPDFLGNKVGPQYIRDLRMEELVKEHKMLKEYTDQLQAAGINAEGLLIAGATIQLILDETEKLHIDLVIIGRHHHGLMYKIFAENVPDAIAKQSKVPVLIVPT